MTKDTSIDRRQVVKAAATLPLAGAAAPLTAFAQGASPGTDFHTGLPSMDQQELPVICNDPASRGGCTSAALPIVVLPGLDGSSALRADFMAALDRLLDGRQQAKLISYSGPLVTDYPTLDRRVRQNLPEGRFWLIGESFGGPAAIRIAQDFPDRVAGLVLIASFARHPWPSWFAPFTLFAPLDLVEDQEHATLRARAQAALEVDVSAALAATRCPIMCVHGRCDWVVWPSSVRHVQNLRPDCEVAWIDGPHDIMLTNPDDCAAIATEFCAR